MTTLTETSPAAAAPAKPRRGRWYGFWVLLAALTCLAIVLMVVAAPRGGKPLDPSSATPAGSRALATLLEERGVPVTRVAGLPAALPDGPAAPTVVVVDPAALTADQRQRLQTYPGDLVLIGAEDPSDLADLDVALIPLPGVDVRTRNPDCALPAAARAGPATSGGVGYLVKGDNIPAEAPTAAMSCYPDSSGGSGLVVLTRANGGRVILFGTGAPLTNQKLAQQGNAALTLGLLSGRPAVVWVMPAVGAPTGEGVSVTDLLGRLPGGIRWGTAELAFAVVLLALARVRRLGPPVTEDLPVSVRSAETTAGRARLYRAARARGTAANTLRDASRRRLAGLLRLPVGPAGPDPAAVCRAAADRTLRPVAEVERLLYGADLPGSSGSAAALDDATLLDLDNQLIELERQVSAS